MTEGMYNIEKNARDDWSGVASSTRMRKRRSDDDFISPSDLNDYFDGIEEVL